MPHVISCSRRTDVPAFYGEWFERRLAAGFAEYRTSYRPDLRRVSLGHEDVLGFVFWTKNPLPFEGTLGRLLRDGRRWAMHVTVTGLPRAFETGIPDADTVVPAFLRLARMAGPRNLYWRYDPIVLSASTDVAWHIATFSRLAARLSGATEQVFTSLVSPYRRTIRNLAGRGVVFDVTPSQKADLIGRIVEVARGHGMTVNACCNPDLHLYGAVPARCINPALLSKGWGIDLAHLALRPSRKHCGCAEAPDIGVTDSCLGGCLYCYANQSPALARKNHAERHDPADTILLGDGTNIPR